MGRYSVYIRTKDDIYTLPFEKDGKLKDKTDIELLDIYFNSKVNSIEDFLNKMSNQGKIKGNPLECFIGYKFNKEIKKKPIIINPIVGSAALSYSINKRNASDKKHIYIDNSSSIKDFIDSIVNMGLNDNQAFKSMFRSNDFPKHVYDLINDYRKILKTKEEEEKKYGYSTPKYKEDLKEILNQINYNIRKYNYFRSIFVWKENYLKKDITNKQKQRNDYEYEIDLFDWEQMNQKNQTDVDIEEDTIDTDDINNIYQDYKNTYYVEISNPTIDYYYKQGGLSAVMANCSLDEIESLSNEEKEFIGYHSNKIGR